MKLNLGCGHKKLPGFVNVDLEGGDVQVDLGVFPWPWQDGTVDEIVASHILEHFSKADGERFLDECYRVLRRGGELRIAVPDMDKFIACHLSGDFSPLNGYKWTGLNYLMGGDETESNPAQRHKYMYNYETLYYYLGSFATIYESHFPDQYDSPEYAAISLYVTAVKG